MKIDYTNYCKKNLTVETDTSKVKAMCIQLKAALVENGVRGHIGATYYTDGTAKVTVNGEYYNMFNSASGKFFSGFVGDSN